MAGGILPKLVTSATASGGTAFTVKFLAYLS